MTSFTNFSPDGIIWSAGKHNIYVNGKPATVYVPPETIEPTFKRLKEKETIPLGIDHLSDDVLKNNEILAKMNLLDVGKASRFGTDGQNIYLLEGEVTNPLIHDLGLAGDLPSYSSVGRFKSTECERKDVDYVLTELEIDRVDFVESGGCKVCKVGSQPDELILTSKLHREVEKMVEKTEEIKTTPEKSEEVIEAQESTEKVDNTELESRIDKLEATISKFTKAMETKEKQAEHDKLEAQKSKAKESVEQYMEAGQAIPAEREALEELAIKDPEIFQKLMASRPKILKFEQLSNHAEATDSSQEDEETKVDEITGVEILSAEDSKKIIDEEIR